MLEILAPAGNIECAFAAMNSGADAIYLGLNAFSARQGADNFDGTELFAVLEKAHFCGVKVYVAMNTIVKDEELANFFNSLVFAWNLGADAIILQDPFLGKLIHQKYPQMVLHLSTQAGVCNIDGAKFAKACGFSRVILARETPLHEIQEIARIIETEVFVQGALCTAFSGQCYFSSFAGGNSGNRGRCKQPCRKQYAYDRNGNTEKCYALSLSDLCVGEDIQKLVSAGVTSFKIEGRMRRSEYVAASVRYYRTLLDGTGNKETALSDLKRTYNRGNYTKGLAFGQDKRLLSTAVQGHLGEKVGVVKVINGKFFVESKFKPRQGDAFKILREGKEVGGASFSKAEGRGFTLYSKHRLKNGDGVFVTTDTEVNERVLNEERKGKVSLSLTFKEKEKAIVEGNGVSICSDFPLQSAQSRPLTKEELESCFLKTDGLSAEIEFTKVDLQGNIFIPKSELNGLRRAFFTALKERAVSQGREPIPEYSPAIPALTGRNGKTAVLATDFEGVQADIAIYKPDDMRATLPESFITGDFEKYIAYPAFCTHADSRRLQEWLTQADIQGVYAENYAGIEFAKANGLKVFAGTGLNLINSLSIGEFLSMENASYYALSKECNEKEGAGLISDKAFALTLGNIKL
ncbi:MAG: U32 family peptidase, partial [Clostridia bacterium]|nr:U32 family peptidase [Clostridia bacterium]